MSDRKTVVDAAPTWTLEERWPCLPDKRHTFAAHASECFCGALRVSSGNGDPDPYVTLITPSRGERT